MLSQPTGDPSKIFKLPATTSGHGETLTVGNSVSFYYDLQPPNVWPEHRHPTVQIVLAFDPIPVVARWQRGGEWITESIETPHVWFVAAETAHASEWKGTSAMLVLYVERSYIREECGCDLTESALCDLARLTRRDYFAGSLCRKFHDLCHGKRSLSRVLVAASGTLLAALLLRGHLCPSRCRLSHERGLSDARLLRVTDYIEAHLQESLTRGILARVAGLTEYHFSRMFRISVGMPPMKYVWQCRTHRARQLLETGNWKVAAVAAETGFFDQSHLVRQFRKQFHCAPGSITRASREP